MNSRQCVICRKRTDRKELFRLGLMDGVLFVEEKISLQIRGAYVHRREECVTRMLEPSQWERSLRLEKGEVSRENLLALRLELLSCLI